MDDETLDPLTQMSILAVARLHAGDLAEAYRLQQEVLAASRRTLGEGDRSTLLALTNLAEILRAQGNLRTAREMQEDVLARSRPTLGDGDAVTLAAMSGLAAILEQQGDLAGARRHFEEVVTISIHGSNEDSAFTLTVMGELARVQQAQGDFAGADALLRKVLDARRRLLGDDHLETHQAASGLAVASFTKGGEPTTAEHYQGKLAELCVLAEEALATSRGVMGEDHPSTIQAMSDLGEVLFTQGNRRGARKLQDAALARSRQTLGEQNQITLTAMKRLSAALRRQGDLTGAHRLAEEAFSTSLRLYGRESLLTFEAMDTFAEVLYLQGDSTTARGLREELVSGRLRLLGEEHPKTLEAVVSLAAVAYSQNDYKRARELNEKALPTLRRALGEEHPSVLTTMDNLATTMHAQGDVTAARALQESVVAAFVRLRGDHHAETLVAMNNLAATMATQGDLIGARILQEQVLYKSRQALGPEHFSTRVVKQNLASTLKSEGIGTATAGNKCVHCLEDLEQETADHVFPRSWYSDRTPGTIQRWTVPSCPRCNRRLALAEKDLLVTMALCKTGMDGAEAGTSARALRAIGIDAGDLSEKEKSHREQYRRKILSRVVTYGMVKGFIPSIIGDDPSGQRAEDSEPVAILTIDLIAPVAEKIVRGLEFKLTGRYIEQPLSLRCFVVPPDKVHVLDYVFEKSTELKFGPGLKVLRAVPTDNEIIAMYRIMIWDALTVDVAVGRFSQ